MSDLCRQQKIFRGVNISCKPEDGEGERSKTLTIISKSDRPVKCESLELCIVIAGARKRGKLRASLQSEVIRIIVLIMMMKSEHEQDNELIKLLESPIPTATATAPPSQKAHFDDISGTKRGSIDPLVSKRPEKNSE